MRPVQGIIDPTDDRQLRTAQQHLEALGAQRSALTP
jgi:hypothetical protein